MSNIQVEGLYTYPIKSCGGTQHEEIAVMPTGLDFDRSLMVVDGVGNFISQRTEPKLAVVDPAIAEAVTGQYLDLNLSAPGMDELHFGHEFTSPKVAREYTRVYVHGNSMNAVRSDPEASEWFSDYLQKPVRLVAVAVHSRLLIKDRYRREGAANTTGFADAFPILLASQTSLDQVNAGVEGEPFGMERFRPNIVVSGELEPFTEDTWRKIQVGQMLAEVVRPCKRCAIPYISQHTGEQSGARQLGQALKATRRGVDTTSPNDNGKAVFFAQNLNHQYSEGLQLAEGDEVIVYSRAKSNVALGA